MSDHGRLQGRVAVVTGAGGGIGYAYAEAFLREGASVLIAELDEDLAGTAVDRLSASGEVDFVRTDVADPGSAEECAAHAVQRFGGVDILVNNAAL